MLKQFAKIKIKTQVLHLAIVPVNLGCVCSSVIRSLEEGVIEWCPMIQGSCYAWFTALIWVVEKTIINVAVDACNSENITAEVSWLVNVRHAKR